MWSLEVLNLYDGLRRLVFGVMMVLIIAAGVGYSSNIRAIEVEAEVIESCFAEHRNRFSSERANREIRAACRHPQGLFEGPNNYHACILEKMPDANNDMVANLVRERCRKQTDYPQVPGYCLERELNENGVYDFVSSTPECLSARKRLQDYLNYE